jgi:molybdopterin synthase catalytic subunit
VRFPPTGDDWVEVTSGALSLAEMATWPILPNCGAVALFAGTVRDHSEARPGVCSLEYEVYLDGARRAMRTIALRMRQRWPEIGRLAMLHRTGSMVPTDVAVVVAVSTPHRAEAFAAASFGIDAIKTTVPIWKREAWEGGSAWGLDSHYVGTDGVPPTAEPVPT